MGLITTGKLASVVSADQDNDYIEISRHDKTSDTYDSYKINVKNLLSNSYSDSTGDSSQYSISFGTDLTSDYVDIVSEQNITGRKNFSDLNATQATGGTATFSQVATNDLVVNSTAMFYNNLTCNGNMYGLAMSACWADLAEYYESDRAYKPGTLVTFGGSKQVTIATISSDVNAVVTQKPGFILNSDIVSENKVAIALVGKTPIRIIGKIDKFDKIVMSEVPGVGKRKESNDFKKIIGISLEANLSEEEKLVMCVTKFEF